MRYRLLVLGKQKIKQPNSFRIKCLGCLWRPSPPLYYRPHFLPRCKLSSLPLSYSMHISAWKEVYVRVDSVWTVSSGTGSPTPLWTVFFYFFRTTSYMFLSFFLSSDGFYPFLHFISRPFYFQIKLKPETNYPPPPKKKWKELGLPVSQLIGQ